MQLVTHFLNYLSNRSLSELVVLFLLENVFLMFASVGLGFLWDRQLPSILKKITKQEWLYTVSTLFFNTVVTLSGFLLIKQSVIVPSFEDSVWHILGDTFLLLFAMDFLMFLFHFVIHKVGFISSIHSLHHEYEKPTALTLFVLNPLEVLGFGSLWLILLCAFSFNIIAVFTYLFLNLVWGIAGHLQKELVPEFLMKRGFANWIGSTKFHQIHHQYPGYNFGFYTVVWDKIFGTEYK